MPQVEPARLVRRGLPEALQGVGGHRRAVAVLRRLEAHGGLGWGPELGVEGAEDPPVLVDGRGLVALLPHLFHVGGGGTVHTERHAARVWPNRAAPWQDL